MANIIPLKNMENIIDKERAFKWLIEQHKLSELHMKMPHMEWWANANLHDIPQIFYWLIDLPIMQIIVLPSLICVAEKKVFMLAYVYIVSICEGNSFEIPIRKF